MRRGWLKAEGRRQKAKGVESRLSINESRRSGLSVAGEKADPPLWWLGRRLQQGQQLAVDVAQGRIVLEQCPVDLRQPLEDRFVGRNQFAQAHECPNHVDAHVDGAFTSQDVGGHEGAMLGERPR